jgi:uncharacterized iron-regulated membrane protein
MIKVSKPVTLRLRDIHGWSAVLMGLALYVVVLTGAIVVFEHEVGAWSVSGHKMDGALAGKMDERLFELAGEIPEKYKEELTLYQNSAGYLVAFFHTHQPNETGQIENKGIRYVLDPASLEIVSQAEGFGSDLPGIASSYLGRFFVDLHVRLHAPEPIGLYLTGLLGLLMMVLAVSGLILHRHLIADMFLSPRNRSPLLKARDKHTLAGTWSIPFSIIVAFTGAFFSFATTLGLPVIAITAFEGDQQKAIETIMGVPEEVDTTPTPFVGLETIVVKSQQADAAGSLPTFIVVEHWGQAAAKVTTFHDPVDDHLFGGTHVFSGVTGEYLGTKPRIGTQPSLGADLIGLIGVLHFGLFAGFLSQVIWLSLGLATCYVTYTGLYLWTVRRHKQASWRLMNRLIDITCYGTVIAMSSAALGFLITYGHSPARVVDWTVNGFMFGILLSVIAGFVRPVGASTARLLMGLMGGLLVALPVMRAATADGGWALYQLEGSAAVIGMDISLLLAGFYYSVSAWRAPETDAGQRSSTFADKALSQNESYNESHEGQVSNG